MFHISVSIGRSRGWEGTSFKVNWDFARSKLIAKVKLKFRLYGDVL